MKKTSEPSLTSVRRQCTFPFGIYSIWGALPLHIVNRSAGCVDQQTVCPLRQSHAAFQLHEAMLLLTDFIAARDHIFRGFDNASCDFNFLIHHRNRRIWNIEKNIFFFCRKIKAESYFLYVRPFKHCTLKTAYPSGREIQQPRTVCDDMSVPTALRCTAATDIRGLDQSAGTDCRILAKKIVDSKIKKR